MSHLGLKMPHCKDVDGDVAACQRCIGPLEALHPAAHPACPTLAAQPQPCRQPAADGSSLHGQATPDQAPLQAPCTFIATYKSDTFQVQHLPVLAAGQAAAEQPAVFWAAGGGCWHLCLSRPHVVWAYAILIPTEPPARTRNPVWAPVQAQCRPALVK